MNPKAETISTSPHSGESEGRRRLSTFMSENIKPIVVEWENFARTLTPTSDGMTPLALRDHIHLILKFIVADIQSDQTPKEEAIKSRGKKARDPTRTAAETHAALRLSGGFNIGQMTSEYRALRASVIKLWRRSKPLMDGKDFEDLTRFNEAIDQELMESTTYYTDEVLRSKDMFIGILGHDLRSPVQAIMLSAELMPRIGPLNERQSMLVGTMSDCAGRIGGLIDTLTDVTRARFGASLPIVRSAMDFGYVAHQMVDEIRAGHPSRDIRLDVSPADMTGEWDKARIGQVFSNLLGNAIQYGFQDPSIEVGITSDKDSVSLTVHNRGVPIPAEKLSSIFDPLTRATATTGQHASMNLGLGLYITQEIVAAHGGQIHVTSSEEQGTTFTCWFPRSRSKPVLHAA
ncbi:sensor histidine kinase [Lichenihabitans psoromatis]|uniref:sensor histidine kinase n=1 Tax=Lichenihabitans psoromatis TaxID=2528642 RepID=UPI001035767D|nr:HAMP domain-containing sensor histidine kinase [Lichenihabitans psoromatis]